MELDNNTTIATTTPAATPKPTTILAPLDIGDRGYIQYTEFDARRISYGEPVEKSVPNMPVKYMEIPIFYNIGTVEQPVLRDLKMEGPEHKSAYGVGESTNNGKVSYSVRANLPVLGPKADPNSELVKYRTCLDKLYIHAALHVYKNRGGVKMADFEPFKDKKFDHKMSRSTGFREFVDPPKTEGRDAAIYYKLFKYGKGKFTSSTLFTLPDEDMTKVGWDYLYNTEMKFLPMIHWKNIYIGGGKIRMQHKMESAIVTHMVEKGTKSAQVYTAKKMQTSEVGKIQTVKEQLLAVMNNRPTNAGVPELAGPADTKDNKNKPAANAPDAGSTDVDFDSSAFLDG